MWKEVGLCCMFVCFMLAVLIAWKLHEINSKLNMLECSTQELLKNLSQDIQHESSAPSWQPYKGPARANTEADDQEPAPSWQPLRGPTRAQENQQQDSPDTVWIAPTAGQKYHCSMQCAGLKNASSKKMYTACKLCLQSKRD